MLTLDPESVDKVMESEETIANDLWRGLRPLLLSGDNRRHAAWVVVDTLEKYGWRGNRDSPLLMADCDGELFDELCFVDELCQHETCRQPATWRGFLELKGVIPVCNQCVVEIDDPVLL